MGWNRLEAAAGRLRSSTVWPTATWAYFVHSYAASAESEVVVAA